MLDDSEGNPTTLESQNPIIRFTELGSYTVTLTVTTECGSDFHSETFNVFGNPTVDIELDSISYCSTSSYSIDFANELIPTYSDGFSTPTGYSWTVTGTDIDSSDYDFVNGTESDDQFPTIQLNSFKTYDITVTVGSNCDSSDSDTIEIILNQQPIITNVVNEEEICSGSESSQVNLISDTENTTFSWISTENVNLTGYIESGTTSFIPAQTILNISTDTQELNYSVTPIANGCAGDPFNYKIIVYSNPVVLDENIVICTGETFVVSPIEDLETEVIPDGTTYSWPEPVSDPVGAISGGAAASNQSNISQTLFNTIDSVSIITYTVTPTYDECVGDPFDVVVRVNPEPQVEEVTSMVLCVGESTGDIVFETINSGGTTTYAWTIDNTDIGEDLEASGDGNIPSFVVTNDTTNALVATIEVTPTYLDDGGVATCIGCLLYTSPSPRD